MSKTNAFLVWDISTIVAHPGRSAYWWECRGALSSQLGQRKSHHISNFSSAEVVTVVATKITVVSDEHQNCVGWGGKKLKEKGDFYQWMPPFSCPDPRGLHVLFLAGFLVNDLRYKNGCKEHGAWVVRYWIICMKTRADCKWQRCSQDEGGKLSKTGDLLVVVISGVSSKKPSTILFLLQGVGMWCNGMKTSAQRALNVDICLICIIMHW